MNDFETSLVVMTAFALGQMMVMALVGWILHEALKAETEGLQQRADQLEGKTDDQSSRLVTLGTELGHARSDTAHLQTLVVRLREELDTFVHGPPSLRSPSCPPGKKS